MVGLGAREGDLDFGCLMVRAAVGAGREGPA